MGKYLAPPNLVYYMDVTYYSNGGDHYHSLFEFTEVGDAVSALGYPLEDLVTVLHKYADVYAGKDNGLELGNYMFHFVDTSSNENINYSAINFEETDTVSSKVESIADLYSLSEEEARKEIIDAFEFFAALYSGNYDPNYVEPVPTDHAGYNSIKARLASSEEAAFNTDVTNLAKGVSVNNLQTFGESQQSDPIDDGGVGSR